MEKEASGSSAEKILGRKIGSHVEWTTLAELDQLEQHPENYRIQGLLVKLRILSRFVGNSHHTLSTWYINYLPESTSLEDEEEFNQILDIRWGRLDKLTHSSDFFSLDVVVMWEHIWWDVDQLISTLSSIEENHRALLNFEKLKISLDLIVLTIDSFRRTVADEENIRFCNELRNEFRLSLNKTLFNRSLFRLLEMIFRLPELPNEHNMDGFIQSLRQLEPFRLGDLLLTAYQKLSDSKCPALDFFIFLFFVRDLIL